jgi:hypothetical protein
MLIKALISRYLLTDRPSSAVLRCMYLVWVRGAFLAWFPLHHPLHPHHHLRTNVDSGKGTKESKNIQDPQNHGNDHDAVQN